MKLYEIAQNYLTVLEMEDELDQEVLFDTLSAIQDSLEVKAENIAKLVRSFDIQAKQIKEEEERLMARRKSLENQSSYLKKYLFEQMERTGIGKIKSPLFTISTQANPPGVDVINSKEIPGLYWNQPEPVLDKKKILQLLKTGEVIPGVEIRQSKGLRIR